MLALLPLSALFLTILYAYQAPKRSPSAAPWRYAILAGGTLWGTCIVLITEGLSLFQALTRMSVALCWAVLCIALGCAILLRRRSQIGATSQTGNPEGDVAPHCVRNTEPSPFNLVERISLIGLALIAALTLVIVLVAAPNNWDSLTYHLPRVMHWIQNRTVAFFVTPDARQICFPPWAEYHILQYQILLDGDRLAALPQWLAYVGSCIGASLIARQLGASRLFQILSSVIVGTLPMAILQASSTQNDLTAGFWLLTAIVFCLSLFLGNRHAETSTQATPHCVQSPAPYKSRSTPPRTHYDSRPIFAALFGLALGLALLTKTTSYLFAAPILLLFVMALLHCRRRSDVPLLLIAGVLALAINAPHYTRNLELCGHPLGDGPHLVVEMRNRHHGLRCLASNLMRNAGLQCITPSTRANELIELSIRFGHKIIGADINDPATTFNGNRYETKWLSTFEDDAANPLHFVLMVIMLPLGWCLIPRGSARTIFHAGVAATACGAVLFCWLLTWQPFHSRLHITLFLFSAPLLATCLAFLPRARMLAATLAVILLATSASYVLGNEIRPLLYPMTPRRFGATNIFTMPRERQYLTGHPLPSAWKQAAREISRRGDDSVGLWVSWFSCEYPLWLIFRANENPPRLQHVGVTAMPMTTAMKTACSTFTPDSILRFSDHGIPSLQPAPCEIMFNGTWYRRAWTCTETNTSAAAELYLPDVYGRK